MGCCRKSTGRIFDSSMLQRLSKACSEFSGVGILFEARAKIVMRVLMVLRSVVWSIVRLTHPWGS